MSSAKEISPRAASFPCAGRSSTGREFHVPGSSPDRLRISYSRPSTEYCKYSEKTVFAQKLITLSTFTTFFVYLGFAEIFALVAGVADLF
jgi:hypothetical protein